MFTNTTLGADCQLLIEGEQGVGVGEALIMIIGILKSDSMIIHGLGSM